MAASPLDDHFHSPRNAGALPDPDVRAAAENPVCGDRLVLYLKLADDGRVAAASFQALGCPAAIAAGSALTELVLGRAARELDAIGPADVDRALGGLDGENRHASVLAADASRAAAALARMSKVRRPVVPCPSAARPVPGAPAGPARTAAARGEVRT